jgi:membrane-bound lytic murein transglycosylase F
MKKKMPGWIFRIGVGTVPLAAACLLAGFARPPDTVERIIASGELVVATRTGPATYYEDARGPAGFEFDLAKLFADYLGVRLRIVAAEDADAALAMAARKEVNLAAAGITISSDRLAKVRFGPAYDEVTEQLVYRNGTRPPRALADVGGDVVAIACDPARLMGLMQAYPTVQWRQECMSADRLFAEISHKAFPYAAADSHEVVINRSRYPELRVAFDLTEPEPIAWAFPKDRDDSLLDAAQIFFAMIEDDGRLDELRERYYGHISEFDYVGVRRFLRHVDERLPLYIESFRAAAAALDYDWRLLAAIGYQESHWDPAAISPTGVQGIMMLTNRTAAELGIEDRIDPQSSISGGARYLRQIMASLPRGIPEPDRTWFALAAYNVGLGHLEDAREITRRRGGDPDRWLSVRTSLPLLAQRQWYENTRYGYARGGEAVRYVRNIRSYYDMLLRATPQKTAPMSQAKATAISADDPA